MDHILLIANVFMNAVILLLMVLIFKDSRKRQKRQGLRNGLIYILGVLFVVAIGGEIALLIAADYRGSLSIGLICVIYLYVIWLCVRKHCNREGML